MAIDATVSQLIQIIGEQTVEIRLLRGKNSQLDNELNKVRAERDKIAEQFRADMGEPE